MSVSLRMRVVVRGCAHHFLVCLLDIVFASILSDAQEFVVVFAHDERVE